MMTRPHVVLTGICEWACLHFCSSLASVRPRHTDMDVVQSENVVRWSHDGIAGGYPRVEWMIADSYRPWIVQIQVIHSAELRKTIGAPDQHVLNPTRIALDLCFLCSFIWYLQRILSKTLPLLWINGRLSAYFEPTFDCRALITFRRYGYFW